MDSLKIPECPSLLRRSWECLYDIVKEGVDSSSVTRANSTSSLSGPQSTWKGSTSRTNSTNAAREKDRKISTAITGSQRGRRGGLSTEDLVNEVAALQDGSWRAIRGRPALSRKTGLLATYNKTDKASQDKEDMKMLTELLNQYTSNGIPSIKGLVASLPGEEDDKVFYIEEDWRALVDNPEKYDKQQQNQQDAIWELLSTEISYIKTLKVVVELFLSCLCNLQKNALLNDIDVDKMFSNVAEIYDVNRTFWINSLLPVLREARKQKSPLNPLLLKDGFSRFDEIFEPYVKYCLEQQTCLQYVKENRHESVFFKTYVAWCESQKDCGRLRFTDLLVKPMQRLTKYSLLLKAILKKTEQPDIRCVIVDMNDIVERFVCTVDARLRQRHELERLESIISRIESYDPFDTSNDEVEKILKENCTLDLTRPMPGCSIQQSRHMLAEVTAVKMKDASSSSKIDVNCFLFTDMLLLCKSVNRKCDKVKVIRQPFVIDRLVMRDLKDSSLLVVYLNEYKVVSSYFQLFSQESVLKSIVENIKKAQEQYARAKAASERAAELVYLSSGCPGELEFEDSEYQLSSPRPSLLTAATRCSPRSSSHSSLVHSHSGSIDMSDPISTSSQVPTVPCPTPLFGASSSGSPQGRATSFELGELHRQDSCCQVDHLDLLQQHRSQSMETRGTTTPVCVTVTSPRPERRAFLLNGCSPHQSNTLTVSVPFQEQADHNSPTIQIPVVSPTKAGLSLSPHSPPSPRSVQRTLLQYHAIPSSNKPPLLKTKNISGLVTHSAPPSEGPTPVHSLDSNECIPIAVRSSSASASTSHSPVNHPITTTQAAITAPHTQTQLTTELQVNSSSATGGTSPVGATHASAKEDVTHKATTISSGSTLQVNVPMATVNRLDGPSQQQQSQHGYQAQVSVQETPNPIMPPPTHSNISVNTPTAGAPSGNPDDKPPEIPPRPHRDLPPPPPTRRTPRPDGRRHHTADSFEHLRQSRDSSIHKRLSWNCGQQHSDTTAASCHAPIAHELRARNSNNCLSSESVYSSSGVSSTGSLLLSCSDECSICPSTESPPPSNNFPQQTIVINGIDAYEDDPIQEEDEGSAADEETPQPVPVIKQKVPCPTRVTIGNQFIGRPGSRIKIDISEVKDSCEVTTTPAITCVASPKIQPAVSVQPIKPSVNRKEPEVHATMVAPTPPPRAPPNQQAPKTSSGTTSSTNSKSVSNVITTPNIQVTVSTAGNKSVTTVVTTASPKKEPPALPKPTVTGHHRTGSTSSAMVSPVVKAVTEEVKSVARAAPAVPTASTSTSSTPPKSTVAAPAAFESQTKQKDLQAQARSSEKSTSTAADTNSNPHSTKKTKDLQRMKELLLNSCSVDAQDV